MRKLIFEVEAKLLGDEEWKPVDMKSVVLETHDDAQQWTIGPAPKWNSPMGPGYMVTHPELVGYLLRVAVEEWDIDKSH